ncbi:MULTISPECIES: hypothetical protein [Sorangium]|uniref:Uncharacterized protein n=1 Tax=Sorangium cellulosum TaxID=56 RepID=A0A4P2QQU4_SORCE|nr:MULTISPECIES: hypothetical protein [Sorangium]AUX32589.1 uncharacterized protein SOCE836_047320 [Sorangium cellulosum]WCQ91965.1 hypothetical protein NQZ70_04692 [Sorangium sp. Soce836]
MISDVEIENEIRALVAAFLEGMKALARKDVLQNAARYLEVDIKAAGISGPVATPMKPARKAERAPAPSRPAAPARSAPPRKAPAPKRAAPRKKAAAPRATAGAARPAAAPAKARRASAAPAQAAPAVGAGAKEAEQARPTSPENAPSGIPGDEIAEALLAHVEIEPGQGIDDLALAMGTPAAELQEPIKKLLEENKITEELNQGQTSYYPA